MPWSSWIAALPAAQSQREVLQRVRAALPPGACCCYASAMPAAGVRLRFTLWVDKLMLLAHGQRALTLHCRSIEQWRELLHQCGFDSRAEPMSHGTPFANVLLIALAT